MKRLRCACWALVLLASAWLGGSCERRAPSPWLDPMTIYARYDDATEPLYWMQLEELPTISEVRRMGEHLKSRVVSSRECAGLLANELMAAYGSRISNPTSPGVYEPGLGDIEKGKRLAAFRAFLLGELENAGWTITVVRNDLSPGWRPDVEIAFFCVGGRVWSVESGSRRILDMVVNQIIGPE